MRKIRLQGFSLVELVVVLVLIGILAAAVASRFLSPSTFDALAARDAILATARSAQQLALGREVVSFTIVSSGGEWTVSANAGGIPVQARSFSSGNILLETASTASSAATCSIAFDTAVADDFSISFDGYGNAVSLTNNAVTENVDNGVRLCINDRDDLAICISPGGFAHEGNCVD